MADTLNTNPAIQRIIATNELITGPPAAEMLQRSLSTVSEPLQVLDNACGGGILTAELLKLSEARSDIKLVRVVAADIDGNMVEYAKERKARSDWNVVEIMNFDQQTVPLQNDTFSHAFNNFGVFFSRDDSSALSETYRITKPGGVAAFASWKTIAWWPSFAMPALSELLPDAPGLPDPVTIFPSPGWNDAAAIRSKFEKAGFENVQVSEYRFTPDFEAEPFAEACAVLTKALTARLWSKEDNEKYADRIQSAYLQYLRDNFPDGRWNGTMVAIISIAKKH